MKDFKTFKNDIYKCSKCGLCQAVCPVYKQTLDECCVSRGKFILLNAILNGELQANETILKDFDKCTSCNACTNFCPSGIDAVQIFSSFKHTYLKSKNKLNIFNSSNFFEFKLKFISIFTNLYRFFKCAEITEGFEKFLKKAGIVGSFFIFVKKLLETKVKRIKTGRKITKSPKIIFFEGCYNKYINPQSSICTQNLLDKLGYNYDTPNLNCCAISKYFDGDFESFTRNAFSIIEAISEDVNYVVCDCATCVSGLSHYPKFFDQAKFLDGKIIGLEDLLLKSDYEKTFSQKIKLTYHKPCHGTDFTEFLLTKLHNIEFVPVENNCCGFAGEFAVKHSKISLAIGNKRAQEIINSGVEIVVTSCPACLAGLKTGLLNTNIKVLMISELLCLD